MSIFLTVLVSLMVIYGIITLGIIGKAYYSGSRILNWDWQTVLFITFWPLIFFMN